MENSHDILFKIHIRIGFQQSFIVYIFCSLNSGFFYSRNLWVRFSFKERILNILEIFHIGKDPEEY